jgi:hypothetical protein
VLDHKLLDILVCPVCKGEVALSKSKSGLVCSKCKLEYPLEDDIPIMLPEEARSLEDAGQDGD